MKSKIRHLKKFMAELLCIALIACSMPGAAFAAEDDSTGKGSVTSSYDTDGQRDTSGAGTETKDSEGTSGTDEKDSAGTNEQGNTKDSDGTTGTDEGSSEGKDEGSGTETKESDSEKTERESEDGDNESADAAQDTSDDEDEGESDGESAKEDDAEADSEDDTVADSNDEEEDTEDEADIEGEDEDESESDVTDASKGGSASSVDEENEEDEDEEEEDWIDGPLDEDLMLLTASPSDATPDGVAEMDGETYATVQDAIQEAADGATITMVDDSIENIIISDSLILTLDLAGFTLEGNSEGSVVTIIDAELTLEDSSGDEGRITGGSSDYGGGVYISDGTFRLAGGTISDNTADIFGGGVYLDSGTFTMTGGIICENTADTAGSDIYAEEGSVAILEASDMMDGDYKWYEDNEDSRYSDNNQAKVCDDEDVIGASSPGSVRGLALVASDGIMPLADGDMASLTIDDGESYTYYSTVQAAVNAAGSTAGTVTMLADSTENVTIAGGQDITLDLAGHTLDGGKAGSVIYSSGTFTLEDSSGDDSGCITGGSASYGGGIYTSGSRFTMNGGTISNNTATSAGGGVYIDGTNMFMNGGIITGNSAPRGGGVRNNGSFNMNDGIISNNTASSFGGGVYVGGYFYMNGGTITGNTSVNRGGGIYTSYSSFYVSGSSVIIGNTTNSGKSNSNVFLDGSSGRVVLSGTLEDGASIGITPYNSTPTEDSPVQITTAESGTEYYKESAQYFFFDADDTYKGAANDTGHYVELRKTYTASLTTDDGANYTYYDSVQAAVNAAGSTEGTVTMLADSTENVTIASDQDITLDLAGYTLDGGQAGSVIYNKGTLTLKDSCGTGCVTNGKDSFGGGVRNSGYFTMENGMISGNTASNCGGGIDNTGTFTMNGGTISYNSANFGGGIEADGYTTTINGGTICNNSVTYSGGGIYCYLNAVCNLFGGTITGNSAAYGGGVYNFGQLNMQDGMIYDNSASDVAADIYSGADASVYDFSYMAIIDAVTMLGNKKPDQCYKWYIDESGNRYSPENITDVYDDENVINAESPYIIRSNVYLIAAGDEGHIYSEENVTFTWDGTDSCTATFTCTECRHEETVNCDITSETVTEPTCTDAGSAEYTATATITNRGSELTVTDEQTEEIKALGHEWVVEQTILEDSEDRYEEMVGIKCRRCGLEYEEEIVVSTESSGVTAHSSLSWSDLLTEDDLADLFESGAELDFKMTAAALSESDVPSADRTLVEDLIVAQWPDADYTASWLDISVLLDIIHSSGEEETREYSSTLNPITITVAIPDELLNADGDTYAVIRIHEGEAAVLDTTDNGDGTLTFESDLFSTYVIVKTAESDSDDGGTGSGGGSRRSNSSNGRSSGSSGSGVSGTGSIAYSTGTWTIDEYGHWRYTDSNGRRYENEWGYIYNPYANTSAGQPSASWFHFGYDGIMDTGWYIGSDGKMYYLNPSLDNTQGAMFTGWVFIDGKWYYFDASGALLRSTQTPDGYTVDETGARVEG